MSSHPDSHHETPHVAHGWLFLIGLLLVARYLRPENGQFGDTLWISGLWLALATLWFWNRARAGERIVRLGMLEACAIGMALAHAIATIPIFLEGGDRRGAANVVWEWVGVAGCVFLIRQIAVGTRPGRIVLLIAAVMVPLAGLGIWQHHISIPRLAEEYARLRAEEQTLLESGEDRTRLAAVRRELATFDAPVEENARLRWENRLRHSTEPFATFALANTLAGLLAVGLPLLVIAGCSKSWSWQRVVGIVLAILVLYCLILTKSRTAWVGLAVGTVIGAGWRFAGTGPFLRVVGMGRVEHGSQNRGTLSHSRGTVGSSLIRVAGIGGGLLAVAAVGLVVASIFGGLDREVLSEAPKSLQYRLEYWEGTLAVLAENPWLGTGPANFRGPYMQHRPLGASEAIASPHNLFLEIWSAGGLLGLLLLLGLLGLLVRRAIQYRRCGLLTFREPRASGITALEWGGLAAFFVVAVLYWIAGAGMDWRLIGMAPLFVAAAAVVSSGRTTSLQGMAVVTGLVALLVHLLGADGIEFPVVIQTLFLMAAVFDGPAVKQEIPRSAAWSMTALWGLLTVGILMTGIVPVLNSAAYMKRAESLAAEGRSGVERAVTAARRADPWSLKPLTLAGQWASSRALASGNANDRKRAIEAWRNLLQADPANVHARERLAAIWLAGSEDNNALARRAARILREAVALSPTEVELWFALARALSIAEKERAAAEAAQKALALDDVNRERGHLDLILDESERKQLEKWTELGREDGST